MHAAEARAGQTHGIMEDFDPIEDSDDAEQTQPPPSIFTTTTTTAITDPNDDIKLSSLIRKRRPIRHTARRRLLFYGENTRKPVPVLIPPGTVVRDNDRHSHSKRSRASVDMDYVPSSGSEE